MLDKLHERMKAIKDQREEIITAFIAQHGCEPDRIVQEVNGINWSVRLKTEAEVEMERKRGKVNDVVTRILDEAIEKLQSLKKSR